MSTAADLCDWPAWPDYVAERVTGVLLRCPCNWGQCGHCSNGDHHKCAWVAKPGGINGTEAYEHDQADTYLVNRKKFALAPVYANGTHHWHCQCDRDGHPGAQPVQLDLFGGVTA